MENLSSFTAFQKIDVKSYFNRFALITVLLFFCKPQTADAQIFTKITSTTDKNPSAGCAWIDYDNSGKLDAYLSHFNTNCFLFVNGDDGSFNKMTTSNLTPSGSNFSGIAWGDYDNDGLADLYVTSMSGSNALFRNTGNGKFVKLTNTAATKDGGSFLSCNWVDYNNDGYLDLFVTASSTSFTPGNGNNNLLYKNNGDGMFTKITDNALTTQKTLSSCAGFADFDNDGDQDVFLTEWGKDNWLFENNGDGTFSKISGTEVNSNKNISITCSWGDYDNDGFLDLFVGNGSTSNTVKQENYLFHNNGNKTFTKITTGDIADYKGCVWTSAWGDVDNDGDLDLYVGTIFEKEELLYINNGDGTFTLTHEFGINNSANGTGITGISFGDYDNDGSLDMLVADASGVGPFLYHNNGSSNNWINITCTGKLSNVSAIGARVKIKATIFGKSYWQMRDIVGVQGFRGSDDLRVHFGLGDAEKIDSMIVLWPSKQTTVLTDIPVNQFMKVEETVPTGYLRVNFSADIVSGFSPLKVNFCDLSVCDKAKPIIKWSWDFNGDGIEDSNLKDPSYVFDTYEGSNFNVSLTVTNGENEKTVIRENYIKTISLTEQNLALQKNVTSSTSLSSHAASSAVDGNFLTYWNSSPADSQWIKIELDSIYSIGKVVLNWFLCYPKQYTISTSTDDVYWTEVISENNGDGVVDELNFTPTHAKFIRLNSTLSSNKSLGLSLREIEIYRSTLTAVEEKELSVPAEYTLYQNYPNPFNPETVISFRLPVAGNVTLKVYDLLGREIATLIDEYKNPGEYQTKFSSDRISKGKQNSGISSGIYFYQLKAGNFVQTKKMLVLK